MRKYRTYQGDRTAARIHGWLEGQKEARGQKREYFFTRKDYWNSDKLKLQIIDIVNLYNGKLCLTLSKTKSVLIRID